jgi:hypothetical protein
MKYSMMTAVTFPMQIVLTFLISKKVYDDPFKYLYYSQFFKILISLLYVNLLLYNYDQVMAYGSWVFDISLFIVIFIQTLANTVESACRFAQYNKLCDTEVAGTHITMFTSLDNLTKAIPSLYIYRLVDNYQMFMPNLIGLAMTFVILVAIKPIVDHLNGTKREDWMINPYQKVKGF